MKYSFLEDGAIRHLQCICSDDKGRPQWSKIVQDMNSNIVKLKGDGSRYNYTSSMIRNRFRRMKNIKKVKVRIKLRGTDNADLQPINLSVDNSVFVKYEELLKHYPVHSIQIDTFDNIWKLFEMYPS